MNILILARNEYRNDTNMTMLRTTIIPVTVATRRVSGGRGGRGNGAAAHKTKLARFLLDDSHLRFWTDHALGLFARLIASTEFVETEGTWSEMRPFVEATLVAHDFTGIERRPPP
jgi:hypothetical protein